MMGLFGSSFDDPRTLATLQLASGLLSSPRFGQGAMQGLLAYGNTMQQSKQQEAQERFQRLREEQLQLQMQQQRSQMEQAQRDQSVLRGAFTPMQGPTQDQAPLMPRFDPREMLAQGASPDAALNALNLHTAMNPAAQKPTILSEGQTAFGPDGKPMFGVPKQEKDPEQIRALKMIYGEGSPQYIQAMRQLGNKMTTHQPPTTSINFGQPMPAVNPATGEVELLRPDNKGGMNFTGIKPPPQDRDVKLPAEIQRMDIAANAMNALLDQYEQMLEKYNPRDPRVQANPTVRAEVQSAMKNIQLQLKEVQALGALAGPDMQIMEESLSDPFTARGIFLGRDGLKAQVGQARGLLKARSKAIEQTTGKKLTAPPASAPAESAPAQKKVVRTGSLNGRKVVQYEDGTVEYAD